MKGRAMEWIAEQIKGRAMVGRSWKTGTLLKPGPRISRAFAAVVLGPFESEFLLILSGIFRSLSTGDGV